MGQVRGGPTGHIRNILNILKIIIYFRTDLNIFSRKLVYSFITV